MKKTVAAIFVILLLFTLCACSGEREQIFSSYEYLGAVIKIAAYADDDSFEKFVSEANDFLKDLSQKIDENVKNSDLERFNNAVDGQKTEVSEVTYTLITQAKEIYRLCDGAYNPCVYYLVDLWGFSARFNNTNANGGAIYDREANTDGGYPMPEEKYVQAFKNLCDFNKIAVEEVDGKYYLTKNNTAVMLDGTTYYAKIDLGGIAKGYAVQKIGDIAERFGITKGYISYGSSSIRLLSNKSNSDWDLELTNPRYDGGSGEETYCRLKKSNVSVASSGDYERCYYVDGIRYSHLIDARSGRPYNSGVCSVTVIGEDAGVLDALSTALCIGGKEKILAFAKSEYAINNGIGIIATFATESGFEVFSTEKITITVGTRYEG